MTHFLIKDANISNIGDLRKRILLSNGIETVKDIEYTRIIKIKGFKQSLARNLCDWRKSLEFRFSFDSNKPINPKIILDFHSRFDREWITKIQKVNIKS